MANNSADFLLSLIFEGDATPLAEAVKQAIGLSAQAGVSFGELVDKANQEILTKTRNTQRRLDELETQYNQTRLNNERIVQEKIELLRTQGVTRSTVRQDALLSNVVSTRGRLPNLDTIIARLRESLTAGTGEAELANRVEILRERYSSLVPQLTKISQINSITKRTQQEEVDAWERKQAVIEKSVASIDTLLNRQRRRESEGRVIERQLASDREADADREIASNERRVLSAESAAERILARERRRQSEGRVIERQIAEDQARRDAAVANVAGVRTDAAARGLVPNFQADGRSVLELQNARRQLRQIGIGIAEDIERVRTAIRQAGGGRAPEIEYLRGLVNNLQGQRRQVQLQMAEIGDALGGSKIAGLISRGFSTVFNFAKFYLLYGAVFRTASGFKQLAESVVETAAEFQRLETSFVSILAQPVLEKAGEVNTSILDQLRLESKRLFRDAQLSAIQTVATTKEYVQVLQSALAVGQNVGLSQGQIEIITKRMVLAAGAFGIELDKVGTSIAQIFTGSVRATNQLGRNLGLATTEQRKLLKDAIKNGELFEFLDAKTRSFAATAKDVQNNFVNVKAAITDLFQFGGTEAIEPLFRFLNDELIKIRNRFIGDAGFTPEFDRIIASIKNFLAQITPSVKALASELEELIGSVAGASVGENGIGVANALLRVTSATIHSWRTLFETVNTVVSAVKTLVNLISKVSEFIPGLHQFATSTLLEQILDARDKEGSGGRLLGLLTGEEFALNILAEFTGHADKARAAIDKISEAGIKLGGTFANSELDRNLFKVVDDYKQLLEITNKNADEQKRFAADQLILQQNLGASAGEFIKNGRLTDDFLLALRVHQGAINDELADTAEKYKDAAALAERLRSLQNAVNFLPGFTGRTQAEENELVRGKTQLEEFAKALGTTVDKILSDQPTFEEFTKQTKDYGEVVGKAAEAQKLLNGTSGDSSKFLVEQKKRIADLEEEQKKLERSSPGYQVLQDQIKILRSAIADGSQTFIQQLKNEADAQQKNVDLYIDELRRKAAATKDSIAVDVAAAQANYVRLQSEGTVGQVLADQVDRFVRLLGLMQEVQGRIDNLDAAKLALRKPKQPTNEDAKKGHERDELNDFIKEVERQLRVLKSLNELIQGEVDRSAELRLKAVKQLGESGAISAQETLRLQEDILAGQNALKESLIAVQQTYLAVSAKTGINVALKQQEKNDAKDKTNTDNRDRTLETKIRFLNDNLELLRKGVDEFRKHEEKLTQAAEEFISRRISERKAELSFLDEYIKRSADSTAKIADIQEQLGLLGTFETFTKKQQLSQLTRDNERRKLINELSPILDEHFQVDVKKAVDGAIDVLSTDKGAGPFRNLLISLKTIKADLDKGVLAAGDAELFQNSLPEVLRNFVGDQNQFQAFDGLVLEYQDLAGRLLKINRDLSKGQKISQSEQDDILIRQKEITEKLTNQFGIRIDDKAIVNLSIARKLLEQSNLPLEKKMELTKQISVLEEEARDAEIQRILESHRRQVEEIDLQRTILEFDSKRLDMINELITKQKEAGTISENEANQRLRIVDAQKLQNLELQKAAALTKLQTATANLKGNPAANPAVAQQQLAAAQELHDLSQRVLEVQLRAHDANSRLKATADVFTNIAEAVNSLPAPFNKLSGALTALAKLANLLDARSKKSIFDEAEKSAQTAAAAFEEAGKSFPKELDPLIKRYSQAVEDSTSRIRRAIKDDQDSFFNVVKQAGEEFRRTVVGDPVQGPRPDQNPGQTQEALPTFPGRTGVLDGGGLGDQSAIAVGEVGTAIIKAAEDEIIVAIPHLSGKIGPTVLIPLSSIAADLIRNIGNIVAASIRTLGATDAGGRISGVGGIVGGLGGFFKAGSAAAKALPIVGGAIEVVGSVISFFGERARQKTVEMAATITKGIGTLRDQINSSAVGLGEGIREMRARLEDARRQLSGRKGGKEELAKIEDQTNSEIRQLQEQAKRIQESYRKQLELLKQPADLRDIAQRIQSVIDQTKEFVDSFENIGDMQQAAQDAMEFIKLSIKEVKDQIQKTLSDLQTQLQTSGEEFRRSERDILLRGRIDPRVSDIENKRRELNDLERNFRARQKEIADQIAAEQKKLDYVNKRGDAEKIIAKLIGNSANQLSQAARDMQAAADAWGRVFRGGISPFGDTRQLLSQLSTTQQFSSVGALALSVDIRIDGRQARAGEVSVGIKQSDHLRIANKINRVNPQLVPV